MTSELNTAPPVEGWKTAESPPPLVEATPTEGGTLTFADAAGHADEANVDVAFRWAKLYEHDFEFDRFWDYIGRRSNPERTDFKQILESLPLTFGPEELPPPLRRHFLRRFGG